MSRGQASIEVMLSVFMLLMVFLLVMIMNTHLAVNASDFRDALEERSACMAVASAVSSVWMGEEGMRMSVEAANATIFSDGQAKVGDTFCLFTGRAANMSISGSAVLENRDGVVMMGA
ncbi:MAG: hypothetical protein JW834_04975 [Candidatus Diapherotrites archaeon]|nr:hypothetical protein [Candidatus Diapherotrites archaeon]